MKISVVIFDFDGTIVDDFLAVLSAIHEVTHQRAMPDEDISRLRGMRVWQLLRALRVPLWRALILPRQVRSAMGKHIEAMKLVPGMNEAIRALAKEHTLFVLSSNSAANVRLFLHHFGIESYFTEVYGDVLPMHKARKLRQLVHKNGLDARRAWYVGDEASDVIAAHKAGLKAAAVSWGFNNVEILQREQPEVLVFSPNELVLNLSSGSSE